MSVDADGRKRRGVYLPSECWSWLDATARKDGSSRSDLLEGLVLLAMDRASVRTEPGACGDPRCNVLHADPAHPIHPPGYPS